MSINMINKRTSASIVFEVCNLIFFGLFTIICLYPFWYILIYSISDPRQLITGGITILPRGFTLFNFERVMKLKGISSAVVISVLRTTVGASATVFACSLLGYIFSKREMPARTFLYRMLIITMYIGGGLIPTYLLIKSYGLINNFFVYILPATVSAYNVILIKTFIEQLPQSLEELAMIDGAGYFKIYLKLIFPLSLPIIATITVFSAVGQWNSWFDNHIYCSDIKLRTLQYMLYNFLNESQRLARLLQEGGIGNINPRVQMALTPKGVRMTVTLLVTLPIFLVYPFMQRFFIKGIMIGAVKG